MSEAEIIELAENEELIEEIRRGRRVIKIWQAVREPLRHPEIAVAGRLTLKKVKGKRVIEWRGVEQISKRFWVPTLMLDATLPDLPILQVYHPQVEKVADIKVPMSPHVHIRQVLHAPTSSSKLDQSIWTRCCATSWRATSKRDGRRRWSSASRKSRIIWKYTGCPATLCRAL